MTAPKHNKVDPQEILDAAKTLRVDMAGTSTFLDENWTGGKRWQPADVLADALMDAGCDNENIIQHCQGPGAHVRGCWVVDLLLGKE
jgi:hypothetical protein